MRVLGLNAVFHDPAAALVVDGHVVAAAEEERFSRRKHGKRPVPFSTWELPEEAARFCLQRAGLRPEDVDAVTYSYDPSLAVDAAEQGLLDPYDHLRTYYAERAPGFVAEALGVPPERFVHVPHHVAHAASAGLATPHGDGAVLSLDGRGEQTSHLAGQYVDGRLEVLAQQRLPHSLGLLYEDVTAHLGFLRSSDEYKVMALASYGKPRWLDLLREKVSVDADGGFRTDPVDWASLVPQREKDDAWGPDHADLASSVQVRLEEVLLDLVRWLHERTGARTLSLAGGTALNCVANTRIWREGPFDEVWVQPAAGDSGTALGSALQVSAERGVRPRPFTTAALGREVGEDEASRALRTARLPHETYPDPAELAAVVAGCLAADGVVAWVQGRSEFGPRALGHRSLLAHPGRAANLERLNDVKGREQFRPVAPMVLADRAHEVFSRGPLPSPYMLFVHDVDPAWVDRIPAVVHVDGTARVQTVDDASEPVVAALLRAFEERTGLPVLVNTSLNTAGRPMVDTADHALELFGSAPVDLLVLGPHVVRRAALAGAAA